MKRSSRPRPSRRRASGMRSRASRERIRSANRSCPTRPRSRSPSIPRRPERPEPPTVSTSRPPARERRAPVPQSSIGIGATARVYRVQAVSYDSADTIVGQSDCDTLTIRYGTFAISYSDYPKWINSTTNEPFTLQVIRTSDEVGPQPAGTVNLYLCPSAATPNPANCNPAANATVNASVTVTTDGTAASSTIRYAERSHVVARLTDETSNRYTGTASITTSEGVATGTAPTITYVATSNNNTTASTWTRIALPNQPLTFRGDHDRRTVHDALVSAPGHLAAPACRSSMPTRPAPTDSRPASIQAAPGTSTPTARSWPNPPVRP